MPNNCVFLVDTYDTIVGVNHAIEVGKRLRDSGHEMVGVRLDSGDLAQLSMDARKLLDDAGFPDASIVASNDLDEHEIIKLKAAGAKIAVWGVGTNLVTARDQPALGGVYKLAAIADNEGKWQPKVKLSELAIKTSTPGIQQVRRYYDTESMIGDVIFSELIGPPETDHAESLAVPLDPTPDQPTPLVQLADATQSHDLLIAVQRGGKSVATLPNLGEVRDYAVQQRSNLPDDVRSIDDGVRYPTGLETRLAQQKRDLISDARS